MIDMHILLNDPINFFTKKSEKIGQAIIYFMIFLLFFIIMNEVSIRTGLVEYQPTVGIIESVAINYIAVFLGLIICSSSLFIIAKIAGSTEKVKKSFYLLFYSSTPLLLLGWVPFSVIKVIALIWSALFLMVGIKIKMGFDYKKSAIITMLLLIMVVIMVLFSRNYILTPIPLG